MWTYFQFYWCACPASFENKTWSPGSEMQRPHEIKPLFSSGLATPRSRVVKNIQGSGIPMKSFHTSSWNCCLPFNHTENHQSLVLVETGGLGAVSCSHSQGCQGSLCQKNWNSRLQGSYCLHWTTYSSSMNVCYCQAQCHVKLWDHFLECYSEAMDRNPKETFVLSSF